MFEGQRNIKLRELLGLNGLAPAPKSRRAYRPFELNDRHVIRNTERVDSVDTVNLTFRPWTDSFDFASAVRKARKEMK